MRVEQCVRSRCTRIRQHYGENEATLNARRYNAQQDAHDFSDVFYVLVTRKRMEHSIVLVEDRDRKIGTGVGTRTRTGTAAETEYRQI